MTIYPRLVADPQRAYFAWTHYVPLIAHTRKSETASISQLQTQAQKTSREFLEAILGFASFSHLHSLRLSSIFTFSIHIKNRHSTILYTHVKL
ncbi:hypothetical protein D3C78_1525140 [compost metagenome]